MNYVIVGKLMWYGTNKTLRGVLLLENNHLIGSNSNTASCGATSQDPTVDYCAIIACVLFCVQENVKKNLSSTHRIA